MFLPQIRFGQFVTTGYVAEAPAAWVDTTPIHSSTQNCGDSVNFTFNLGNTAANTNLNWSASSNPVLNVVVVNQNVYPSLLSNLQTYLGGVKNLSVKTVTSISAMVSELAWADVVTLPTNYEQFKFFEITLQCNRIWKIGLKTEGR